MASIELLKSQAKRLRSHLASLNIQLSYSAALEAVAAMHGHKDWNTIAAVFPTTLVEPRVATVCISAGMSAEDVMAEAQELLRGAPDCVCFRLDCEASGRQHREAHQVAREIELRGVKTVVDSPLSL
ncbi:glyoxalase superfamily protein [Pseudomonas guariconensis]|uniref:glyoxalase superfamily protein n=1 Tax=Pseudomonas guariconensis TaxID=1288410 RepID=UPI003905B013